MNENYCDFLELVEAGNTSATGALVRSILLNDARDYLEQRSSKRSRASILERKICDIQVPNNAICFLTKFCISFVLSLSMDNC